MSREELCKEAVMLLAEADRIETLLLTAALGAILESDGRFEAGYIDKIKAEYSPEEFNKALEKTHIIKAIGQRDGDAVLCETCDETAAFILGHLIGKGG